MSAAAGRRSPLGPGLSPSGTGLTPRKRRRRSRRTSGPDPGTDPVLPAQARRQEVAQRVAGVALLEAALIGAHRAAFEPAQPPVADRPERLDIQAIRRQAQQQAVADIPWLAF